MIRSSLSLPVLCLLALLSACSSTPTTERSQDPALPTQQLSEVQRLLQQAEHETPNDRTRLYLQAIGLLLADKNGDEAKELILQVPYQGMSEANMANYDLLMAELELEDNSQLAYDWLEQPAVAQSLDPKVRLKAHLLRAKIFSHNGSTVETLLQLLAARELSDPEQQQALDHQMWQNLLKLSPSELDDLARNHAQTSLYGWSELALSIKLEDNPSTQISMLNQWLGRWPQHPGINMIGEIMQIINSHRASQAEQIALFLPLSGKLSKAGKAVRDGFISAYYQTPASERPKLKFYDTHQQKIAKLVSQAAIEGADLIIGPLGRSKAKEAAQMNFLPIPMLSLNSSSEQTPHNLYQFGLAVEDEARQAAKRAYLDQHRRAAILTPDNSWGHRAAAAFSQQWEILGGEVSSHATFSGKNDYRQVIGKLLGVDKSEQRSRQLEQLLGEKLETKGRRRQDIDMIFVAASPEQGRRIQPTLAFQYAAKLPIYAAAKIHNGLANTNKDKDLNGVRFTGFPWILKNNDSAMKRINRLWPEEVGTYTPLYALGNDAYTLQRRLHQLINIPAIEITGSTGTLSLEGQRINRRLEWFQIKRGRATALAPPLVSELSNDGLDPQATP